ncbi:MAG: MarR family transcriptional regulator [Anaerolineaceae bacterium]|nr:MarR family transcriptional regulator [Anaerolineaceae bacterium]
MKPDDTNLQASVQPGEDFPFFNLPNGQDIGGMKIAHSIRVLARLFDLVVAHTPAFGELSGSRLGVLLRLYMEEKRGNTEGINPTTLSRYHDVRKNTISSLLNGLEENGLVERKSHPKDRRASLVRITTKGRELVESSAPQRFKFMNQAVEGLSIQERDQLILLLDKLRHSILANTDIVPPMCQ